MLRGLSAGVERISALSHASSTKPVWSWRNLEMTAIAGRLEQQYPDTNTGRHVIVRRLHDQVVGDVRLMLYVLLAAVVLVLLIACGNLATRCYSRARLPALKR